MHPIIKSLLKVGLQIGIGSSVMILLIKPYRWYIPIIFIILWTALWVGYDALMREK